MADPTRNVYIFLAWYGVFSLVINFLWHDDRRKTQLWRLQNKAEDDIWRLQNKAEHDAWRASMQLDRVEYERERLRAENEVLAHRQVELTATVQSAKKERDALALELKRYRDQRQGSTDKTKPE